MEKGVSKYWTPGKELESEEDIKRCRSFAERHLTMLLRDFLKYDGRSKEGRRARAQARLRFAIATDKDLEDIARLEVRLQGGISGEIPGLRRAILVAERLGQLKKDRAQVREKGINKEELRCR